MGLPQVRPRQLSPTSFTIRYSLPIPPTRTLSRALKTICSDKLLLAYNKESVLISLVPRRRSMYLANTTIIPWSDVIGYVHEVQRTFRADYKFRGIEMSSCKPADRTDNLCDVITHTETITERWMFSFNETCTWRAKPISCSTDHRFTCGSLGGVAK